MENVDVQTKPWPWAWESSQIDWCEGNFEISSLVAEFWNTVSNFLFFLIPPVLIFLFQPYAAKVTRCCNVVWALIMVVGLGSVYFHATLSLIGQLLDEIAIIWLVMAAIGVWYPKEFMPSICKKNRTNFKSFMLTLSVLSTGLACIMPAINCVVLFVLAVPATYLMVVELKRCNVEKVYRLGIRCCILCCLALGSWVVDSCFCVALTAINFPYMHCFWHIFIALASYTSCVLFAYFDAEKEVPELNPVIQYWPKDTWKFWGIPYVTFSHLLLHTCPKQC